MAGGPLVAEERRRNKEWALEHFWAPELRTAFHTELSPALTDWFLAAASAVLPQFGPAGCVGISNL